jgi:hypothetical protein
VLDDENYDNSSIEFCLNQSIEQNDSNGKDICEYLLTLSISDRILLLSNNPVWELDNFDYNYIKVNGKLSVNDFVIYEGDEYPLVFVIGNIVNDKVCIKNRNDYWYHIEHCTKIVVE